MSGEWQMRNAADAAGRREGRTMGDLASTGHDGWRKRAAEAASGREGRSVGDPASTSHEKWQGKAADAGDAWQQAAVTITRFRLHPKPRFFTISSASVKFPHGRFAAVELR